MEHSRLPLILEPAELEQHLHSNEVLVVDVCKAGIYQHQHIPGAVHLDYRRLTASQPPVMGLLPDEQHLSTLLASIGLRPDQHVVAYDEEGGGKASRLLWTLDVVGHSRFSLLNGGLQAWIKEGHATDNNPVSVTPGEYPVTIQAAVQADRRYILSHLQDPETTLLDARSPAEYNGTDVRARRGGHIPGAVNIEWTRAIDQQHNLRLRREDELRGLYEQAGVTPDKEVITYCHTHHRSAHTYIALKSLGYPRVKGYPGSWSDWGNAEDTPVEA